MRIRGVSIDRAQLAWVCDITFTLTTVRQFTDETHTLRATGQSLLTALLNGWRAARAYARENVAKPGERMALGWSD